MSDLPIAIPSSILHIEQRKVLHFIWQGHRSRLPVSMLYHCKLVCGLAVLHLKYYTAAQIVPLVSLHVTIEIPIWVHFMLPIPNLLWTALSAAVGLYTPVDCFSPTCVFLAS